MVLRPRTVFTRQRCSYAYRSLNSLISHRHLPVGWLNHFANDILGFPRQR